MPKRPASKPAQSPTPAEPSSPPLSESGRLLQSALGPDYELGELLGRGGFAEVYVAWDRRLKREVAVKTIRGDLATEQGVLERFRREAEAVAQLRHPHIVPIYSVGESNGIAFFTMPRIRGESLAQAIERGERWSFSEVVRILREAAGALAAAHRNGIVHRDVKPENIMLDGPERRVVVMDFGIAKSMDESVAGGLTGTGILVGTPYYMSPEQAAGDKNIDHLSDQYSLALVGYRMLAGRLPFDAESIRSVLFQQAAVTVTPVRELRPDVPAALSHVIERALQKDPAQRYRSMDGLADALAGVAGAVAGEFRTGRRAPSMADRWSSVRLEVGGRSWRYVVTALVAFVGFVLSYTQAEFGPLRRLLGQRDENFYAARAYLATRGATQGLAYSWGYNAYSPAIRILHKAVGRDSVDALLRNGVPLLSWSYFGNWQSLEESWSATVGDGQRILRWQKWLGDSVSRPTISADSARKLADAELGRQGFGPAEVTLSRRFENQRPRRTDRNFTFDVPATRIVHGADTVHMEISVGVSGDQATWFNRAVVVTPTPETLVPAQLRRLLSTLAIIVLLSIGVASAVLAARRSGSDTLQWGLAARWAAVPPVLLFISNTLPRMWNGFASDTNHLRGLTSALNSLTGDFPEYAMIWLIAGIGLVAVESLSYEKRPELMFGASEWARGRLAIPESIPAALFGYPAAFVGLTIAYGVLAIGRGAFGWPIETRPFDVFTFNTTVPALGFAYVTAGVVGVALAASTFVAFAVHFRVRPWVAAIALGLATAMFRIGNTAGTELRVVMEALLCAYLTWLAYRRGALATMVTACLFVTGPLMVDYLWAGGPYSTPGLITLAFMGLPAIVALNAYRRRPGAKS
jgi:tRNA A-37 threonylcarbamoyl transferase component Bud32